MVAFLWFPKRHYNTKKCVLAKITLIEYNKYNKNWSHHSTHKQEVVQIKKINAILIVQNSVKEHKKDYFQGIGRTIVPTKLNAEQKKQNYAM